MRVKGGIEHTRTTQQAQMIPRCASQIEERSANQNSGAGQDNQALYRVVRYRIKAQIQYAVGFEPPDPKTDGAVQHEEIATDNHAAIRLNVERFHRAIRIRVETRVRHAIGIQPSDVAPGLAAQVKEAAAHEDLRPLDLQTVHRPVGARIKREINCSVGQQTGDPAPRLGTHHRKIATDDDVTVRLENCGVNGAVRIGIQGVYRGREPRSTAACGENKDQK